MGKAKEKQQYCVLTMALYPEPWQIDIIEKKFSIMEHLKNSLIAFEFRKLKNVERTKEYKNIMNSIRNESDEKVRTKLWKQRNKILTDAGFTEFAFKDDIVPMQKHFVQHIGSNIARPMATNVFSAFEKVMFGSGDKVSFCKKGTLNSIQNEKYGTAMRIRDGYFEWSGGEGKTKKGVKLKKITIKIKVAGPKTYYEKEMLQKEIRYLRVVKKWVKNRYKYYLQFILKGNPVVKPRVIANDKRVGIDIGPSSAAISSDKEARLVELADRVQRNYDKKIQLQRSMDRSRRNMNPQNFNENRTIKRGVKLTWIESNHYKEMRGQVRELERKNADIRKYQHICLANYILSLGTEVYVEQMNFKGLQRRAKETKYDENGRPKKKKRFGKSIANRAPAMFITILKNKLLGIAGKELHEVNTFTFKASQYDHTNDDYKKKSLKDRWAELSNGDKIQRDLYSAFLLMNSCEDMEKTNREKCEETYERFKTLHDDLIKNMKESQKKYIKSFGL